MRLALRHLTTYRYSQPIDYAIQTLHLTPRPHDGLAVLHWRVRGDRNRPLPSFLDGLGNLVHSNSINRPHQTSTILVEGEVETRATAGAVCGAPEPLPPSYFLRTTALTTPDDAIAQLAVEGAQGATVRDRLFALLDLVRKRLLYYPGITDSTTTAARALALGSGVCQDHAHLFIAACRFLGVPARYVGGYLWTGESAADDQANHAWVEAHLDDIGWIGFDPANVTQPDETYIRVAVGLDYWSAAPIRGVRRGQAGETLSVTVKLAAAESPQ